MARVDQDTQLVNTMGEVVTSIRRVTDILGEISAASREQSAGVSQAGEAVTQMDQATPQNAGLVKEMTAAASGLNSQVRCSSCGSQSKAKQSEPGQGRLAPTRKTPKTVMCWAFFR